MVRERLEARQERKELRRSARLLEAAIDNDRIGLGWTVMDGVLMHLEPASLYRLLDRKDLTPGQAEAVRWELTRRQGQSALNVARWAIAISVLALVVSVVWHN